MENLFFEGIFNSIYFIGGIFILGMILNIIEDKNVYYLEKGTGRKGLLITGIIGVPVHELSHYIMCRIFLHRVEKVELFRPAKSKEDGVFGRVVHSREKRNPYKMLGDFFIGTAPVIIGSFIIYYLIKLYLGSESKIFDIIINIDAGVEMINNLQFIKFFIHIITASVSVMFLMIKSESLKSISGIIILFAIYSVSIHLSLSKKDIENSIKATMIVALIITSATVIFGISGIDFQGLFINYITKMFTIMTICIIICVPFTLISIVISYIGRIFR